MQQLPVIDSTPRKQTISELFLDMARREAEEISRLRAQAVANPTTVIANELLVTAER